ncbi:MAG: tetratricopeptide repeat protein, partial [Methanoregulaceae archaeon]|nr:tetratricopeptide repeat protein [Methanoregulaceae archaeon]
MTIVKILPRVHTIICLLLALALLLIGPACAVADDCGCGGVPDASPPSGWDNPDATMDDSGGLSSGSGSGPSGDSSSSASTGPESGSSYDSGSSSSSSSSSGSSSPGSGGGAPGDSSFDNALTWRKTAEARFAEGNLTTSLDAYNMSLRIDPYSTKAWSGKGDVLTALGNYTEALSAYDRVIRLDPGDEKAWIKKGGIFMV